MGISPVGIALAASLALAGCAALAQESPKGQSIPVSDEVVVSFTEPQNPPPFDPHEPRLQEASEQMARIAGHPIELRFDAALMPEWRSSFEVALVEGIENIARDLAEAQKRDARMFDLGAPLVKRVFCKYDAIARESDASLDAKTGEVTITMPAQAPALIPRGAIYSVMEDAFDDNLERRFASTTPDTADDPDLYFYFLTSSRRARHEKGADLTTDEGLAKDPRSIDIERVARLGLRVPPDAGPESLHARITKWLLREGSYLARAYDEAPAQVQRAGKNTAFHRAEAAYVSWLEARFDGLSPAQKREVLKLTTVRMSSRDHHAGDGTFVTFAFPGFDWMGHALAIVDAWIAAGHPVRSATPRELQDLYDEVVCPFSKDERGHRTEAARCDRALYEFAFDMGPASYKRFVDHLVAKKDVLFVETAFANAQRLRGEATTSRLIALWRAVENDAAAWETGARVIADQAEAMEKHVLVDELGREWKSHPERRGPLLFLFTTLDRYGNGAVDWARFSQQSGAPVSQTEFASFMAWSPLSISNARLVWPTLGRGWSRADLVVPRLDAYVDDPLVQQNDSQDPARALHDVVKLLCAEGQLGDLAKVHGYFQSRIAFHAGDAQRFAAVLDDSREGKCKVPKKPRAKPAVVSSDTNVRDPFVAHPEDDPGTPFGPPTTP